jgi:hypothetical protein
MVVFRFRRMIEEIIIYLLFSNCFSLVLVQRRAKTKDHSFCAGEILFNRTGIVYELVSSHRLAEGLELK